MLTKFPCKGCTKRYELCHSFCEEYIKCKAERAQEQEKIIAARKAEDDIMSLIVTARRRRKRS